jgi:hypothetical protein
MLFVALAFVFFAAPLVQKAYILTSLDASFMFIGFLAVMLAEGLALAVVLRLARKWQWRPVTSFLLATGLMALNVFHFFFVVSNSAPLTLAIIVTICSALILAGFWSARASDFVLGLCGVMLLVMCATEWAMQHNAPTYEATSTKAARGGTAQRSVYVIAFDALASRQSLKEIYGLTDLPHVTYLEQAGFQVYDTFTPGHDTIDTFVEWFSLGTVHTSRNGKHYFNGTTPNPLYSLLREKHFKIQFIYHSNYFGVDAGRIDSFYPEHNAVSICEFVDPRYLFGICSKRAIQALWRPVLLLANRTDLLVLNKPTGGYEFVANRLAFARSADAQRWFSVSYVWFPGHSDLFPGDDLIAKEKYVRKMAEKIPQLNDQFGFIQKKILANDPGAAIILIGDHGGWATGSWTVGASNAPHNGTKELLDLDRRGVLLAVYPRGFCHQQLAKVAREPALLLNQLLDCASTPG